MMRVRIIFYVCAIMYCKVQTNTVSVRESDEQSALQEALLLVELLKSEYTRVLRENTRIKQSRVDDNDLRTCATTTAAPPPGGLTHTQSDQLAPRIEHFPRRRFHNLRDYYGDYGSAKSMRRMDYDNVFGPQPGLSNSTASQSTTVSINHSESLNLSTVITTASTVASETPLSTTLSRTSNSSTINSSVTSSETTPKPVPLSVTTLITTQSSIPTILSSTILKSFTTHSTTILNKKQPTLISKHLISSSRKYKSTKTIAHEGTQSGYTVSVTKKNQLLQKKLSLLVEKTTVLSTNGPEQAQVAAELEKELEADIESSTSLSSSRYRSITWRPSTRVHLARSTPYYLPLPENHAFCYTNPESSLCRTFIK